MYALHKLSSLSFFVPNISDLHMEPLESCAYHNSLVNKMDSDDADTVQTFFCFKCPIVISVKGFIK
jgi:hypothetical protein